MNFKTLQFFLILSFYGFSAQAQTGRVGINTKRPSETFHINGTLRITDLPVNNQANAISTSPRGIASPRKNQKFIQQGILAVDKNGVVGLTAPNVSKTLSLLNNATNNTRDLTNVTAWPASDGYLFDGNYSLTITMPKCIADGQLVWFYGWGGITAAAQYYTFNGTASNQINIPSSVALPNLSNYGITYTSNSTGNKVVLKSPGSVDDTMFRFRYTKIEFLCLGTSWFLNHQVNR